ncbi:kelch-like protein 40a isoform X2 [Drosophila gunungcola]|uniref:kelch-like protein 40a isoform X2 n=1 Tax=Drosophila gunungcola TaxID=103775 RepID=UPI0022E7DA20|nr:kelch-like protein 40a isoform X2 [Drosophila gunungcola]
MNNPSNNPFSADGSNRILDLRKHSLFSDIVIRIGSSNFKCHKIVLACASQFFEMLFQREGLQTGEVVLQDTTPDIFEIFLDYIYTRDVDVLNCLETELLLSLFKCANMWLACEVEKICEQIFLNRIDAMKPAELVQLFAVSFHLGKEFLYPRTIGMLHKKRSIVCPETLKLGIDCFMKYFEMTCEMTEGERFDMLDKWVNKNMPEVTGVVVFSVHGKSNPKIEDFPSVTDFDKITVMLNDIDLTEMSFYEFYCQAAKSNLLNHSDQIELMYQIGIK